MHTRNTVTLVLASWRRALALAALAALLAGCGSPHAFGGTLLTPPQPAPSVELIDQRGQPFSLSAQRGKIVLMYFGYTHCPDVCPATLGVFKALRQRLGSAADDVRLVFITVDPERDSPPVLDAFLAQFDAAIVGLTGPRDALARVERDYGVYRAADLAGAASGHPIAHTERIFVIDRAGDWRLVYPFDISPDTLAEDLRALP